MCVCVTWVSACVYEHGCCVRVCVKKQGWGGLFWVRVCMRAMKTSVTVGEAVGDSVGDSVGEAVGEAVGDSVGEACVRTNGRKKFACGT